MWIESVDSLVVVNEEDELSLNDDVFECGEEEEEEEKFKE